ncbi:KRAB domain-containing zinc finger protein [Sarotherodon galilaeus]
MPVRRFHSEPLDNPEVLYEDRKQTGKRCNLIFFTHSRAHYRAAIEEAYPTSRAIRMDNKLKLELSDGGTVSIFDSGIIVIQGKEEILDAFENRFDTIKQSANRRR